MKKALVISFTFPPIEGIGGRRWAKFSKYLLREGVDVQVITAALPKTPDSEWLHDIAELREQNRIHFFKTSYPEVLVNTPVTLYQKILYRFALFYVKSRIKGNYYDKSALCKKHLLSAIEPFIDKGYHHIILSIGPFYYATFLTDMKKRYPFLNLVLDVRDPWTNNKTSFGYSTLAPERFKIEKEAEKKVSETYDHIVSVADEMGDYFITEYQVPPQKVKTIKNGFDLEDIPEVKEPYKGKRTIVFTGNLYQKAQPSFLVFFEQLQALRKNNPALAGDFEFHFYGEMHASVKHYFTPENGLYFHDRIPLQEVYGKISSSSACLLFLTDDLNFSFSTKFYEYLALKKPVLVFSKPGKTGEFVENNNIGRQMNDNNLEEVLISLQGNNYYHRPIEIQNFDVRNLTKKYLELIH